MESETYQHIHVFHRGGHSDIHPCNGRELDRGLLEGWSGECTLAILLPPGWLRIHCTCLQVEMNLVHTILTRICKSQSHCWEVIVLSSYFTQVIEELAIETVYKTKPENEENISPFPSSTLIFSLYMPC